MSCCNCVIDSQVDDVQFPLSSVNFIAPIAAIVLNELLQPSSFLCCWLFIIMLKNCRVWTIIILNNCSHPTNTRLAENNVSSSNQVERFIQTRDQLNPQSLVLFIFHHNLGIPLPPQCTSRSNQHGQSLMGNIYVWFVIKKFIQNFR